MSPVGSLDAVSGENSKKASTTVSFVSNLFYETTWQAQDAPSIPNLTSHQRHKKNLVSFGFLLATVLYDTEPTDPEVFSRGP